MILYIRPYTNVFSRFLYSLFVLMPVTLWLRFFALVEPGIHETFVNKTNLTNMDLNLAWMEAQDFIATNSFPLSYDGGPLHAPDLKARTITPENVTIIACPDEPGEGEP